MLLSYKGLQYFAMLWLQWKSGDIGDNKMWPVTVQEQDLTDLGQDRIVMGKDRVVQLKWSKWEGKNVKAKEK